MNNLQVHVILTRPTDSLIFWFDSSSPHILFFHSFFSLQSTMSIVEATSYSVLSGSHNVLYFDSS